PRADPRVQVLDGLAGGRRPRAPGENEPDDRRRDEECHNPPANPPKTPAPKPPTTSPTPTTPPPAQPRNSVFPSPGPIFIARPKIARESIGTGTDSPLGRIRFMLSR